MTPAELAWEKWALTTVAPDMLPTKVIFMAGRESRDGEVERLREALTATAKILLAATADKQKLIDGLNSAFWTAKEALRPEEKSQ